MICFSRSAVCLTVVLLVSSASARKHEQNKLKDVRKVFVRSVKGGLAAERISRLIREGKTCFSLVEDENHADAVFDVTETEKLGNPYTHTFELTVTLTVVGKSGKVLWATYERWPGQSSSADAEKRQASKLMRALESEAECLEPKN
jgi:hypothetical protein